MKILYIVGGLPFGGVENLLFDLGVELKKRKDILFKIVNLSGQGVKVNDFQKANLPLLNLCNSYKALNTYRIDTAIRLRKVISDFQPDIIQTMHFAADYFTRLACLGMKVPIITNIRNIKHEKKVHRRFLNKCLSLKTTAFIAISKAVKQTIIHDHLLCKKPIHILYNAVNFDKFNVEPIDYKNYNLQYPVLIGVGRLVPQKNFNILISACDILHNKGYKFSLVIIGDGPEKKNLEQLVLDKNLEQVVRLMGYKRDVGRYLHGADIFIMPSEYEGFGNALIEAMYCGLPAVISQNVPAKEIAEGACLISSTEADDIAGKIEILLTDREKYKEMSMVAESIAQEFNITNYLEKLLKIYTLYLT